MRFSISGTVLALALQDDGKIVVGGYFLSVNGLARTNIARLKADGSVDENWDPGANDAVRQILVSGPDVFVLGDFTVIGGQNRNGLAKLSTSGPGAADPLWNPDHPGNLHALAVGGTNLFAGGLSYLAKLSTTGTGAGESPWGPQPDYNIFALATRDAELYVAGNFSMLGNATRSRLAKVTTLGSGDVDPTWDPNVTGGNLGVIKTLVLTDSFLYLGGSFDLIGAQTRKNIARVGLEGTGAADPIWNPGTDREAVYALAVNGDSVYAAGSFAQIGGLPRSGLAKLSASGAGAADPSWIADTDGQWATALAVSANSAFAGGPFVAINGVVSLSVAKLDTVTGARDDSFPAQVGRPGNPLSVARQEDGKVIVGGDFCLVGNLPCKNLARFNVDGTLDTGWRPGPDGRVTAIAIHGGDIYVAGAFTKIGGQTRRFLAKLSASGTDAADAMWDPNPPGPVDAIAIVTTNVFVASSGFTGETVLKLSAFGAGEADPDWNAGQFECFSCPSSGPIVWALAADAASVYVAGEFDTIQSGADSIARSGLVKLSATGTGLADRQWDPSPDGVVYALALDSTNLYVAGRFAQIGGQNRTGLARVSTAGTGVADPGWSPDLTGGYVQVLALNGTNLCASGSISSASGLSNAPLVRLSTSGSGAVDSSWNPNPHNSDSQSGTVLGLAEHGADVYVVGEFDTIAGETRHGFAFLPVADAPSVVQDPAGLMILRNPGDGPEVTYFRITGLVGVALFQNDGVTPINANDFISVEQGSAGLVYTSTGTVTVVSALNNTPAGAGTAANTVNLDTTQPPITRSVPKFLSETLSPDGRFQFVFSGERSFRCVIEASVDLRHWIPVSTNLMSAEGVLDFVDPISSPTAQRYYRIQQTAP